MHICMYVYRILIENVIPIMFLVNKIFLKFFLMFIFERESETDASPGGAERQVDRESEIGSRL